MTRIVKDDFDGLTIFVQDYSLASLVDDKDFISFLSKLHKKFYSYLVLVEELRLCVDVNTKKPIIHKESFKYLEESASDCGQCLFLAINGCYKGTRLLLRSSIENFLKGICMDEVPQIIVEKSVFQVFDDAASTNVFKENKLKENLHNIYSELCMDVHTADSTRMASVSALKFFPHFDKKEAEKLGNIYIKLLPIFITALCIKFNSHFHSINYQNKEVISKTLIDELRATIYGE